jgi:hypothetical protein
LQLSPEVVNDLGSEQPVFTRLQVGHMSSEDYPHIQDFVGIPKYYRTVAIYLCYRVYRYLSKKIAWGMLADVFSAKEKKSKTKSERKRE